MYLATTSGTRVRRKAPFSVWWRMMPLQHPYIATKTRPRPRESQGADFCYSAAVRQLGGRFSVHAACLYCGQCVIMSVDPEARITLKLHPLAAGSPTRCSPLPTDSTSSPTSLRRPRWRDRPQRRESILKWPVWLGNTPVKGSRQPQLPPLLPPSLNPIFHA